jgi:hypothetical protein
VTFLQSGLILFCNRALGGSLADIVTSAKPVVNRTG